MVESPSPKGVPSQINLSISDSGNLTDINYLPEKFQVFTPDKFVNTKACEVCDKLFGFGSSKHHWYKVLRAKKNERQNYSRKCGKCVCDDCSKNKRQLSRQDKNFYRVCDYCDKKMGYANIEAVFKSVEDNRINLIQAYQKQIAEINQRKLNREKRLTFLNSKVGRFFSLFISNFPKSPSPL